MEGLARAVFGLEGAGCEGYAVAFGSEGFGCAGADVLAGADDEGDRFGHVLFGSGVGVGSGDLSSGREVAGDGGGVDMDVHFNLLCLASCSIVQLFKKNSHVTFTGLAMGCKQSADKHHLRCDYIFEVSRRRWTDYSMVYLPPGC
jgi:hypothetical protein